MVFLGLMGLSMFVYVVLDGFDLGVGMLLPRAGAAHKDMMIASIGPFWDANETWLVLGIGILLIAFPKAHGVVMTALYLPIALMLVGLIAARRGVRLPRQGQGRAQGVVEPGLLRRLDARVAGAGLDARALHHRLRSRASTSRSSPRRSRCACPPPTR